MSAHLKNIAIIGATGNSGTHILSSLLSTARFNLTAITRANSSITTTLDPSITILPVTYDDPASLTSALQAQDCLIVTMNARVPKSVDEAIYRAAAAAGVKYVITNDWGLDYEGNPSLAADVLIGDAKVALHRFIESLKGPKWIGITCGFWYEWSLPVADAYGFDFARKEVTFFDGGEARINTSTFGNVGRSVAALLSLPITNTGTEGACLEEYADKSVYVSSFLVSQREMFASVLRVTGDEERDWTVRYEKSEERYSRAVAAMKEGDMTGFARAMYTRVFYSDGGGNFEERRGLSNGVLGLEKEDLDEATRRAVDGVGEMRNKVEQYRKGTKIEGQ